MPAIAGVFSGYQVYYVTIRVLPSVLLILHIRTYIRRYVHMNIQYTHIPLSLLPPLSLPSSPLLHTCCTTRW